jgi:hypothetical protein
MAKTPKTKSSSEPEDDPIPLPEPGTDETESYEPPESPWLRGLHMLVFAVLLEVAQWVLLVATVLQFLWLLFAKEKNAPIAEFGASLSKWLARAARFQTAATEDKPFPWSRWGE